MYPPTLPPAKKVFYDERECFQQGEHHIVNVSTHRNCHIEMHSHEFYEINIVESGVGCHYIEKMAVPLQAGDVFVIPPHLPHGYYCESNLNVCHILLKSDFMRRYHHEISNIPGYTTMFEVEPYLRQVYDQSLFLHLSPHEIVDLNRRLHKMEEMNDAYRNMHTAVSVLQLICDLCYALHEQTHSADLVSNVDTDIVNAMEYIQKRYGEKVSLEDLCAVAKMSRATFNRHFKKVTQMSPMQYVINRRVNAAKQLLANGQQNKTEIALQCGFYDVSHLDKYLKQSDHGETP